VTSTETSFPPLELSPDTPDCLNVAELIVAYLERLEVDYVFGVPGGAIEPLYNALAASACRGGPRPVVARHETGAAFMADGYTRESGRIGVCVATSGPGATNLITGVACAYDNGIPMLVITGQPALPLFGKRALQESACTGINTLEMFRHCTHYNSLVSHPDQLEAKLVAALMRATRTPRGPVHLSIPLDILRSPTTLRAPSYDIGRLQQVPPLVSDDGVEHLGCHLIKARRIVILLGGGCGAAAAGIVRLAQRLGAMVVTTPDGKGLIAPGHPLHAGVFGFAGHASAEAALRDPAVDLILAVGASMGEWTSAGWSEALLNGRLIHVDESDEHFSRSPMAKLHVQGHLPTLFERLTEWLGPAGETQVSERLPQTDCPGDARARMGLREQAEELVHPHALMHVLGERLPPATRFLADAGNSMAWAIHYLKPRDWSARANESAAPDRDGDPAHIAGGWLRVTMDFAPMGWAIGGAVGTALANPNVPVVCLTGDGSILMNGQEISTAVAEKLSVIFIVLNDAAFGMVKHGQRLSGASRVAYELPRTDFAGLAAALGAHSCVVRSVDELATLDFPALCRRNGPTVVDVHIDGEAIPPIGVRIQALRAAAVSSGTPD